MCNNQQLVQRNQKLKINSRICKINSKVLIKMLSNLVLHKMVGHGGSHSKRRDKHVLLAKTRECKNVKLIQQQAVSIPSKHRLTSPMSSKTQWQRREIRIPLSQPFHSWVRSKLRRIMEEHTVTVSKLCCNSRFKKSFSIIQEELRYWLVWCHKTPTHHKRLRSSAAKDQNKEKNKRECK